jgi:ABC-2 type transport system permease protein
MLWFKAWRETRVRVLLTALVLIAACSYAVFSQDHGPSGAIVDYKEHVWKVVYGGQAKGLYAILLLFLGIGGLLQERSRGTAMFTLILPVSRLQVVAAAVGVGLLEMAALALLPALLLPLLSLTVHQTYPLVEALEYSLLWFGFGTVLFSVSFVLSSVLSGEYTAAAASFVAVFGYALACSAAPLRPYRLNILVMMSGMEWIHVGFAPQYLFAGHLPWIRLFIANAIALALLAVAVRVTQRQDF